MKLLNRCYGWRKRWTCQKEVFFLVSLTPFHFLFLFNHELLRAKHVAQDFWVTSGKNLGVTDGFHERHDDINHPTNFRKRKFHSQTCEPKRSQNHQSIDFRRPIGKENTSNVEFLSSFIVLDCCIPKLEPNHYDYSTKSLLNIWRRPSNRRQKDPTHL